jgi:glycosyltransferase involved in cell wall biosynthesis
MAAYRRAWIVIIPSRWDTFPTVMLEAMSLGKPVVASPHGGMPEMLENTLCRALLPESKAFTQQIELLLSDARRRHEAGESLRRKALAAYAPDRIVSRYLAFIESSLGAVEPRIGRHPSDS